MPVFSINTSPYSQTGISNNIWLDAALGNLKALSQYKDNGQDLNSVDLLNQTPLHWAAQEGQTNAVSLLLSYGVNIDSINVNGDTALNLAVKGAHLDTIRLLISKGANANIKNLDGNCALFYAEHLSTEPELVYLLLEATDVSRIPTNHLGQSLLHKAAEFGISFMIIQLIERGYDINMIDDNGCTPLHIAASNGQVQSVKWLINLGANVNIVSLSKQTLLHAVLEWAACLDTIKTISRMLIKAGVKLRARDENGVCALELAQTNLDEKDYILFKQFHNKELSKIRQDTMVLIQK